MFSSFSSRSVSARWTDAFGVVARLDAFASFLVLFGVLFGLVLHPLDFLVGEAGTAFDGDRLGVAGAFVLGFDVDDTVLVDVERDLDLRRSGGCRRDARKLELAEQFVLVRDLALTLEDTDLHRGLVRLRPW